jgi:hypothetical protein
MQSDTFRVGAAICAIYEVPVEKSRLMNFLANPKMFERYMPNVNAVRPKGASDGGRSLYEWEYEIAMPLAAPIKLYILTEYERAHNQFIHTAIANGQRNMMNCSLTFEQGERSEQTFVTMNLEIILQRTSGAELHPLGMIMGEQFMSAQMKSKMQTIATEFLQNTVNALCRSEAA